ncbi:MAG: hypothetical protein CVT94_09665 [Bacteroidetes bacterium HGW-Bacteroidetes-11]|jgi:hypothetical protein|nr:MAG: hypothetical protein CVT94_09665 [Bacteroidetes bacterium HGW-Bacteroidetes-11]
MLLKGLKEKMTMRILIIFIFIISIASCSETIDPERYLSKMAIDLKGDFLIIRQNSSPAIGDLLIEFELKLGQIDYDNFVNSIKSHKSFALLDSLESYPSGMGIYPQDIIKEFACFRNGTYYKHLFIPDTVGSGWETYTLYLDKDSTLFFQYNDE